MIRGKIVTAPIMPVINLCTYPVVYFFQLLGINTATAVVSFQVGYFQGRIHGWFSIGRFSLEIWRYANPLRTVLHARFCECRFAVMWYRDALCFATCPTAMCPTASSAVAAFSSREAKLQLGTSRLVGGPVGFL